MPTEREKACLDCKLWSCDDTAPECAFTQITRDYYTGIYYPAFRSKEIARVSAWQKENKDKLAAAQSRYQKANRDKINARRRERKAQAVG